MKRTLFLSMVLIALFSSIGRADPAGFLSPDQAFIFSYDLVEDNLILNWDIAEGYYLYQQRLAIKIDGEESNIAKLPPAEIKQDAYFGEVSVFHHKLNFTLPYTPASVIEISYQGCAEAGLCYPPQSVIINTTAKPVPSESQDTSLQKLLNSSSHWYTLLVFFAIGIVTAFAGCSYPMFPILSKIIVGQGGKITKMRGLSLSVAYVLPIAIVYAAIGVIAGLFGKNLSSWMQTPVALTIVCTTLALMALSMFGLFKLQVPNSIQSRLSAFSGKQTGGSYISAVSMGFISAFIVSACVVPPIVAALTYITQSGDIFLGAGAMFFFGLGLGFPLLLLGVSASWLLPKSGDWMESVQKLMGVFLMSAAIFIFDRIVPGWVTQLLWASLAAFVGVYLIAYTRSKFAIPLGVVACSLALFLTGQMLFQQLSHQQMLTYNNINSISELQEAIDQNEGQAILIDYYADWCVACQHMEHEVFTQPLINAQLKQFQRIKIDLSQSSSDKDKLMQVHQVFGPPSLLFLQTDGHELRNLRVTGELGAEDLSRILGEAIDTAKAI